jgi:hypothetical protein
MKCIFQQVEQVYTVLLFIKKHIKIKEIIIEEWNNKNYIKYTEVIKKQDLKPTNTYYFNYKTNEIFLHLIKNSCPSFHQIKITLKLKNNSISIPKNEIIRVKKSVLYWQQPVYGGAVRIPIKYLFSYP